MSGPVTWVCKGCKMPFKVREYAERHTREAHKREPKGDPLYVLDKFMQDLGIKRTR